jgi:hypothetical protein
MNVWPVADLMEFAKALSQAPDSFVKRRVMQRVDGESLTIPEATVILRAVIDGRNSGGSEYDPPA